jgi:hypothetical protein
MPTKPIELPTRVARVTTVWIYVDTSKQVGDKDHLKVFTDRDAADRWFAEHGSGGCGVRVCGNG